MQNLKSINLSLSTCPYQLVSINLSPSTCLHQPVCINLSLSTCLYQLVSINLSLSICLCHLVSGRLGRRWRCGCFAWQARHLVTFCNLWSPWTPSLVALDAAVALRGRRGTRGLRHILRPHDVGTSSEPCVVSSFFRICCGLSTTGNNLRVSPIAVHHQIDCCSFAHLEKNHAIERAQLTLYCFYDDPRLDIIGPLSATCSPPSGTSRRCCDWPQKKRDARSVVTGSGGRQMIMRQIQGSEAGADAAVLSPHLDRSRRRVSVVSSVLCRVRTVSKLCPSLVFLIFPCPSNCFIVF